MMSQFAVLTRLKEPENSSLYSKMLVYDGENLKDTDPRAKSFQEYRDYAGVDEGMSGISTRFAFKIISKVFNFDSTEVAANPVHLMYVLEQQIEREQFPAETEQKYLVVHQGAPGDAYAEFIGKEIQTAYLESYSEYGQNIFDRYVTYADYWIQDHEYRDTDTGEVFDRGSLNAELEKIEKPAGIANPKDFRNEIVNFVLRARANNQGKNPLWTSYEKLRTVIEKKMFSNTEELLPVISFNAKASADEAKKHEDFVTRMVAKGYTRQAGAPAVRVVPARAQEFSLTASSHGARDGDRTLAADHRSAAGGQEQVHRQPRALPAPPQGPDPRGGQARGRRPRHPRHGEGRGHPHPASATSPSRCSATARAASARWCTRATRTTCAATASSGPRAAAGGGGGGQASDSGEGEDDFVFHLSKEEFMQVFFDDLALPHLARTHAGRDARVQDATAPATRATARRTTCTWCARCAARSAGASRWAARSRARAAAARGEARRASGATRSPTRSRTRSPSSSARSPTLRARLERIPYLDPIDLRYRSRVRVPVPTSQGGDVLPDGRVGLDGRSRARTWPSASSSCCTCS